jgi:hypothetical protein
MPRIRTIKPEFWQDEKLGPMAPLPRLVFLGLISMADDTGRVVHNVKMIDAFVFPWTDDTCADALELLSEAGRVVSGLTDSGQRVLEIANWSRHQKIDKPNMAAALPPITAPEPSELSTDRRKRKALLASTRDRIFARDGGSCCSCGVTCKRYKADKYDAAPNLAEIDHIRAVADGGGDEDANLQLLCLQCNRRKHGLETIVRNNAIRGGVVDTSSNDRRHVVDTSTLHTNDQRPVPTTSTNDHVRRAKQPRRAPGEVSEASKYPAFTQADRAECIDVWKAKLGVVNVGQLIATLGPMFRPPEDAAHVPHTAIVRGVRDYCCIVTKGRSSPFMSVADLGKKIGALAENARTHYDDPITRTDGAMLIVHGTTKVAA